MKKLSLLIAVLLLLLPTLQAQDDVDNLLDLLNAVPDLPEVRESLISFVDYKNVFDARQGAPVLTSFAAIDALPSEIFSAFSAALQGIYSGPEFMQYLFAVGEEWEATVGFDFFDLDRAVNFGDSPANFNVLVGEFDTDAVGEALSTREYTSETLGDMTLWCGNEDCDGTQMNIENRNPANIFGGDLGRSLPVLVSDTTIVATTAREGLILVEDAIGDRFNSIADNTNYQAAVSVIDRENILIQGVFVHPFLIINDLNMLNMPEDLADELEQMRADALDLPQYNLIMIADTATDSEQVVYVTLVYNNESDAESAVESIPERIETQYSLRTGAPLQDLFDIREITVMPAVVFDEETEHYLAVFEMRAPLATNTVDEDDFRPQSSSMVYQLFIQMIYSQDTVWLAHRLS